MLDILIVNGMVIDGSGEDRKTADIGIRDGRIVAIGAIEETARRTIDASGRVVSPGFIDVHTHYDAQVFWDPALSPSCFHGVTTAFAGFCGFSIAPLTPASAEYLLPMLARVEGMPIATLRQGVPWNWTSFASYLARVENRVGINIGFFAGHSAIRSAVMGDRAVGHQATRDELEAMKAMLDQALSEGALGFSTTKSPNHNDGNGDPVPSRWASREEFLELATICARHEGTALEFLPDLRFDDETVDLMIAMSLASQRAVNWNLLSVDGADDVTIARIERLLDVTTRARARGAEIMALALPVTSNIQINLNSGYIFDAIPGWEEFFRLPVDRRLAVLADPVDRQLLKDAAAHIPDYLRKSLDVASFRVVETFSHINEPFRGRQIGQIAREQQRDPIDVMFDIAVADRLQTSFRPEKGGETIDVYRLRAKVWQDDRALIGASDAGAHMDMIDTFAFSTRVLERGVRTFGVIGLEQAIRQMTDVPARYMGLRERGLLKEGFFADIVIFDPATVGCGPTYTRFDLPADEGRLYADAIGISHVIVNGQVAVEDGIHTGMMAGTVLHGGRDTVTVPLAPVPMEP